jgi:hypothetical protein
LQGNPDNVTHLPDGMASPPEVMARKELPASPSLKLSVPRSAVIDTFLEKTRASASQLHHSLPDTCLNHG